MEQAAWTWFQYKGINANVMFTAESAYCRLKDQATLDRLVSLKHQLIYSRHRLITMLGNMLRECNQKNYYGTIYDRLILITSILQQTFVYKEASISLYPT